uniref:Predicted protein n=1 Tax=Physcomitrium patens TaxID=3218 RepID=A9TVX1_PHYPA
MESQQPADSTQEPLFADLQDETLRLSQPSRRRNRDEHLQERHVLPRIDGEIQRVWYHDLGRDSRCLVILLEVGTTPDGVPNILFEGSYEGLNNDQITGWSSRPDKEGPWTSSTFLKQPTTNILSQDNLLTDQRFEPHQGSHVVYEGLLERPQSLSLILLTTFKVLQPTWNLYTPLPTWTTLAAGPHIFY